MYVPICELRRSSTMLPLRSRTSWRLRALTVTCLPRDWTRAGVNHFANNRRRGHDLPEGHYGEPVEQAWATRHTRQSLGLADPGPRQSSGPRALQVRQDNGTRQALSRPWTSSTGSLRRRNGHHPDRPRQQRSCQHHPRQRNTNRYQLQLGKSDPPRAIPGHRERPRPGRPSVPSGPQGA